MEKANKYLFLSIISIFCVVILSLLIGNNKTKIENINETIKELNITANILKKVTEKLQNLGLYSEEEIQKAKKNRKQRERYAKTKGQPVLGLSKEEENFRYDIGKLIEEGFDEKVIMKVYVYLKPNSIEEIKEYLTLEEGKYKHKFISNRKDTNNCVKCNKVEIKYVFNKLNKRFNKK